MRYARVMLPLLEQHKNLNICFIKLFMQNVCLEFFLFGCKCNYFTLEMKVCMLFL